MGVGKLKAGLSFVTVAVFLAAAFLIPTIWAQTVAYDIVIRNGHIIDGSGSPWYAGDVGIREGKIAAIGNLIGAAAQRSIDARGKIVAPGFIDMLGQSEHTILVNPHLPSKIFQGITTEITGEGGSVAPLNGAIIKADHSLYEHLQITPDWRTLQDYFRRLERQGMGINLGTYVGATQVRRMVLGDANRAPNPEQLEQMQTLVREAMQQGGAGGFDISRICASSLRQHRGVDCIGERRRKVWWHICHAHAQRRRRRDEVA